MATRFYFGRSAPSISPAVDAVWGTFNLNRVQLLTAKLAESLASTAGNMTPSPACGMQGISAPLEAQTFNGTVKAQIRAGDSEAVGDLTARLGLRIVSGDGSTVRGTLLAVGDYSSGGNLLAGGFRNKTYAAGGTNLSAVSVQAGDRLVVEIGAAGSDSVAIRYGANSSLSDLPEDETSTSDLNGWIEFSVDLTFQAASSGAPNLLLRGVG